MKLVLVCLLVVMPTALRAGITLRLDKGAVLISGVPIPPSEPSSGWQSLFPIYTGTGEVPPAMGRYVLEGSSLSFHPRFPFSPGILIRAESRADASSFSIKVPSSAPRPAQAVKQVYPTTSSLPENQLKFYLEFTGPMSRGEVWRHLRLLRADGSVVDDPFLEIEQELWNADQTRLTVLFDPGRIKRGLLPLTEVGPAIEAGKGYQLVILPGWKDGEGNPLLREFRKSFDVVPPDRQAIEPKQWKVTEPPGGTREPLLIEFGEPLDFALASRAIAVPSVDGQVTLGPEEKTWQFVPSVPWKPGSYTLRVNTSLEDLAGNRVNRLFDVDVFEQVTRRVESRFVELSFSIR